MENDPAFKLAELLLEVAGRAPTNYYVAKREARVLAAAMEYMSAGQRATAKGRINKLGTKWGSLLAGASEIDCTPSENPPVQLIAHWLRRRHHPERILKVLHRAAEALELGMKNISAIHDYAYAMETDRKLRPVTRNTFRQWLTELRLGMPKSDGAGQRYWEKGSNHRWFVEEHDGDVSTLVMWRGVTSSNPEWLAAIRTGPLYAAALAELVKSRRL